MRLDSFYPVLLTDDVAEASSFFTKHMGFKETFRSEWYVSLIHGGNDAYELAIISHDHETIPEGYRRPTTALLLNFEVPSVEGEYERLRASRSCSRSRTCPSDSDTLSAEALAA